MTSLSITPISLEARTPEVVRVSGVPLFKGVGGELCPPLESFSGLTFTETHVELLRVMALGIALNQPVLIEGGSGLGKTTMARFIAAATGSESYLINCQEMPSERIIGKMGAVEGPKSGFGFIDGLLLQAVRNGGIVLFDEYNKLHGDTRSAVQPVIDALVRGEEYITVAENNGERIKIHENFRILATQNGADGDHAGREPLDKPDYTRWVCQKFADDLSSKEKLQMACFESSFKQPVELAAQAALSREALLGIPGYKAIMKKFVAFHEGLAGISTQGSDALQPVSFVFTRDLARVQEYVAKFYAGDLNQALSEALKYYFENRYGTAEERAQVANLSRTVKVSEQAANSKRIALPDDGDEASLGSASPRAAAKLNKVLSQMRLEGRVIGPDEIKSSLNVRELGDICRYPKGLFEELTSDSLITKDKKVFEDHRLVYIPERFDNKPNSFMHLKSLVERAESARKKFEPGARPVFRSRDWYNKENWAQASAAPGGHWILTPDSAPKATKGIDFAAQSKIIAKDFKPYHRGEALELESLLSLTELSATRERLYSDTYGWTETETDPAGSYSGQRVNVGYFNGGGFLVALGRPALSNAALGAFLCWNFRD